MKASGAYISHTYKNSPNELINQVSCESSEKRFKTIDENIYIDLFWPYLGPKLPRKFSTHGPFVTHTWKYPQIAI